MLPASNRGVGMNIGFPDVCLTPTPAGPVPIPYPNFALNAQAVAFSPIVKVSGVHALNLGSKIPMTFGDDAGTAHPVFKQVGAYVMGNPIVSIDRLPAINLTCPTTGNAGNNAVGAVLVPSAVNVFYSYLGAASGDNPRAAVDLRELGGAMLGDGPVTWAVRAGGVGYVRVAVISSDLPTRFRAAVLELHAGGMESLVVDLRGCPGGDVDAAIRWAADFVPAGAEIVRIEDADGDETVHRASGPAVYTMPLTVLVDGGTASAAELVVSCLKAHGRATLTGERTHGKATLQHVSSTEGALGVQSTAARWRGPGGVEVDGVGVCP